MNFFNDAELAVLAQRVVQRANSPTQHMMLSKLCEGYAHSLQRRDLDRQTVRDGLSYHASFARDPAPPSPDSTRSFSTESWDSLCTFTDASFTDESSR